MSLSVQIGELAAIRMIGLLYMIFLRPVAGFCVRNGKSGEIFLVWGRD